MRPKNIILLSVIVCIGGALFVFVCKFTYDSKVAELKQKAREAFEKALGDELKSRNLECGVSFYSKSKALKTDMPDSVYVEDENGRHLYRLDPEKSKMNIAADANIRSLQSITFLENPINLDSFTSKWREYLIQSSVFVESTLCISITNNDTVNFLNKIKPEWCSPSHAMFVYYIGFGNEIEVIGYSNYSYWHIMGGSVLFYLLIYSICVGIVYKVSAAFQKKMIKVREKEIIESPVIDVNGTSLHSYVLHRNIIFCAERNVIEVNGIEQKIKPQLSRLLYLFIQHKDNNYILADKTIMQNLWSDECDDIKLVHKVITRLRVVLREVDASINITRSGIDAYQLLL